MAPSSDTVHGGTVVTAEASFHADIGVSGEHIAAIGTELEGARVSDARGLLVAPGGIDAHTHTLFATTLGGEATADDYEGGSCAAAAGGVTTFVNFAFQDPARGLLEALDREESRAAGSSHVDYSFHVVVTDPVGGRGLRELPNLATRRSPG
jgi:dihydropyrimidinase